MIQSIIKKLKKIKFNIKKYFVLNKLSFHFCVYLTEHCNLNCQMCNTFSPLAKPKFYSINDYEKDCKQLSKIFRNRTHKIFLMGGEPLLHPDVSEFMKISRKYFPLKKTKIEILTNAILLLSMPESFWTNCKKYNIEIAISKYPINIDYEKIEEKAKEYDIQISYHKGFVGEIERKSYNYKLDEKGQQDINNAYRCYSGSVSVLKYGKLYKCPICSNIDIFNTYFNKHFNTCEKDYIDLSKKYSANDILLFLYKPSPFCRYCIIPYRKIPNVIDWNYSKKDIKEWT